MRLPFVPRIEPNPGLPFTSADITGIKGVLSAINEMPGYRADLSLPPYRRDVSVASGPY